jgi:hypothetical protein
LRHRYTDPCYLSVRQAPEEQDGCLRQLLVHLLCLLVAAHLVLLQALHICRDVLPPHPTNLCSTQGTVQGPSRIRLVVVTRCKIKTHLFHICPCHQGLELLPQDVASILPPLAR